MQKSLEQLSKRGEQKQQEQAQSDLRQQERQARTDKRQARTMAIVSMTWLGEYWPDDLFDWVAWIVVLFAIPWVFPVPEEYKLPIDVLLIVGFLVAMMLARFVGGLRFKQEMEWLKALPFPVMGYVESLGDISGRVSVPFASGKAVGFSLSVQFAQVPTMS